MKHDTVGLWVHVEGTKKAWVRAHARKIHQGDYTMKSFNTQTVAKTGFTKSKAFGLCGTLAIATALLIGAGSVSADEVAQPAADAQPTVANVYTADNAGNITVTPSETVAPVETPAVATETAPVAEAPAPVESQPIAETPVAQPVAETTAPVEAQPTTFVKEGDTIQVSNPNVEVDQSQGTGKYQGFTVEYKDVKFPDDMAINEGDKVKFTLPEEVKFQTNFDFDVHNPEKAVVGKATADATTNKVTTVFNDYFKSHPLNKIKLVDDYFEIKNIESLDPWIDKGSAMDLVKSISKSEHGFEIKMDRLDHMVYLYYKTKLVNAVKDSTNPTNKIELKAESDGAVSYTKIQLVGGKGDASGENKPEPTFEIPREAPKVDIPEFEGGIPGIPEVRELPEYNEPIGTVPNDAPKYEKPEFEGGVVPNDAPVYDKPSIDINDIPLMPPAPVVEIPEWHGGTTPFDAPSIDKPEWSGGVVPFDAPVLDLPELEIPVEPEKPTPEKPSTPEKAPKTSVERPNNKVAQYTTVSYKLDSEPREGVNTPVYGGTLPVTGEKEGIASTLGLVVIAAGITALTLGFKKHNECEE